MALSLRSHNSKLDQKRVVPRRCLLLKGALGGNAEEVYGSHIHGAQRVILRNLSFSP